MPLPTLKRGLEHGTIVLIAPEFRRIMKPDGTFVTRPSIGVRLNYARVGELPLPSGRLVPSDPSQLTRTSFHLVPQVAPGTYPVWTILAETRTDCRAAIGVVQLSDEPAVRFETARFSNEDPESVKPDSFGGVGVDSGMAAVMDATYLQSLSPDGLGGTPDVEELVAKSIEQSVMCASIISIPGDATMAAWRSGFGDGMYTPIWGIGRSGTPCFLAIDFEVVANGLHGEPISRSSIGESFAYVPVRSNVPWWKRVFHRE